MYVINRIRTIILMILIIWLLTRYYDNRILWHQIDIVTLYFIVWQIIYLICKWDEGEPIWPILIVQQVSCCLSTSITAFLWLLSLNNM
ncbi:unnamed protein product [Rotaria sp. Silwood1]|nr:unnamed protein product [Rotaria sp. Silwood1]CAF4630297.1 unnamed protein product [Rotaria sp. Silwood1]